MGSGKWESVIGVKIWEVETREKSGVVVINPQNGKNAHTTNVHCGRLRNGFSKLQDLYKYKCGA